jgi:hypothetical protein
LNHFGAVPDVAFVQSLFRRRQELSTLCVLAYQQRADEPRHDKSDHGWI